MSIEQKNCVDIAWSFAEAMAAEPNIRHQLFGGIGSAALTHEATQIDSNIGLVIAPPDLYVPQYRDKQMKNLRDLDDLVLDTDDNVVDHVESIAKATIKGQLRISVFGLHKTQELDGQVAHPLATAMHPRRGVLADRYVRAGESGIWQAHKAVFPFAALMDMSTLETWNLSIGQRDLPIPHPGATILNYLTRSISGLRPKDRAKVDNITKYTLDKMPDLLEWLEDGPGASQLQLARILHTLREPKKDPETLVLGEKLVIKPLSLGELAELPEFMAQSCRLQGQRVILGTARTKSQVAHFGEKSDRVVNFWQNHVEPRISKLVKNK